MWNSYEYYTEGFAAEYMWYRDITVGEEKYRGVYFTSYRPNRTTDKGDAGNSYQDDNGYYTRTTYWFKYEPIKWRIIREMDDVALLICDSIIDSQAYNNSINTLKGTEDTVYVNNYMYSSIRSFLNENFLNKAFSELQKNEILTMSIDNSAISSNPNDNSKHWNDGVNEFYCNNTQDKVFLLSIQEVTNAEYGFSTSVKAEDVQRERKSTAYAQCQGVYVSTGKNRNSNGWWWLRSPNCHDNKYARDVNSSGSADRYTFVNMTQGGVLPSLYIKL